MTEILEEKEVKGGAAYVGRRLSMKEVKFMLVKAKTPEERAVLLSLMPKPQKRYG